MKVISNIFSETIEIIDVKSGETIKEIPFTVNVSAVADIVVKEQKRLAEADKTNLAEMGAAFIGMLKAIFGEKVLSDLLDYYGEDYMTMIVDLTPLLTDEIFPVFDKYRQRSVEMRKKIKRA